MRNLSRREFLRLCGAAGAAAGLADVLKPEIAVAFAGPAAGKPPVIWLQGGSCSGCSVSLLNSVSPSIAEVLTGVISLKFHQTLMSAAGDQAMDVLYEAKKKYKGQYVLIVEGTVPAGAGGRYATLGEKREKPVPFIRLTQELAADAKAVLAVGSCASFGGIPAGQPNPTDSLPASKVISGVPIINIPGCPSHPDWVLGTVVHLLKYGLPDLDAHARPKMFFGSCVHDTCGRRKDFDKGKFATRLSEPGCLYKLGCKGPLAFADCPTRKFNGGTSWCVAANSPCLACVEPEFPDKSGPFFVRMPEYGPAGTAAPQPREVKLLGGDK
ncbi:MAG: hydrogenase small subunit [Negativicutes bacterium]|nr:hydrogenase small subunit [Negativicutes bacterium]